MPPKKASARKTAAKRSATKKATARRTAAKKTTAKKTTARKTTAKKTAARKTAARKTSAKKTTARRPAAKKSPAKKTTAKKSAAKKTTAKKTAAKKTTAKKSAAKKSAAKKSAAKKATARKTTAKKAPARKASPATTGASADAIELLTADHREVEQLFSQLEAASPESEVAQDIADKIVRELSIHAVVEEQILYPVTRREVDEAETEHAIDEHQEVKELLAKVDGKPVDDPDVLETFRQIKSSVEEHVKEEENEMFPGLRRKVDQQKLQQMGEALERAKKLAPTHPHPNAPSRPPGNVVAGAAASVIDRLRDAARR